MFVPYFPTVYYFILSLLINFNQLNFLSSKPKYDHLTQNAMIFFFKIIPKRLKQPLTAEISKTTKLTAAPADWQHSTVTPITLFSTVLHRNFNSVLVRVFRCEGALTRVNRGHVGDTGKCVTSRLYSYATPEANIGHYKWFYLEFCLTGQLGPVKGTIPNQQRTQDKMSICIQLIQVLFSLISERGHSIPLFLWKRKSSNVSCKTKVREQARIF